MKNKKRERRSSILKPTRGALLDLDANSDDIPSVTEDFKKRRSKRVSFAEVSECRVFTTEGIHNDEITVSMSNNVRKPTGLESLLNGPLIAQENVPPSEANHELFSPEQNLNPEENTERPLKACALINQHSSQFPNDDGPPKPSAGPSLDYQTAGFAADETSANTNIPDVASSPKKVDTKSFLQKLGRSSNVGLSFLPASEDVLLNTNPKIDTGDFLQRLKSNQANSQVTLKSEAPGFLADLETKSKKRDTSTFLASLSSSKSAQSSGAGFLPSSTTSNPGAVKDTTSAGSHPIGDGDVDEETMEMTACLDTDISSRQYSPAEIPQTTLSLVNVEDEMEMTECLNDEDRRKLEKMSRSKVLSVVSSRRPLGDITLSTSLGNLDENECISSGNHGQEQPAVLANSNAQIKKSEVVPEMHFLPTATEELKRKLRRKSVTTQKDIKQTGPSCLDETRLFGADPMGDMDLTVCIGGLKESKSGQFDKTMVYEAELSDKISVLEAEQTGKMDFTTCIGGQVKGEIDCSDTTKDTMEFTTCVGGLDKSAVRNEKTLFETEPTANMDFTACVGGLESRKTGLMDKSGQLEKTRVFGAEALGDMDLTTCVGGLESRKTGLMDKSGQLEKTTVFGAEALGDMDLTTCVGGLESRKTGLLDKTGQVDETRVFGTEPSGDMDFTTCVGGLESKKTGLMDKTGQVDQTRVFGAEAAGDMDFTTCIGGLESRKTGSLDKTGQVDEARVFGTEPSGDMDFTTCIGGLESRKTGSLDKTGQVDETRVFGTEPSGNMDFTTCVGGLESKKAGLMDKTGQADQTRVFGAEAAGDMDFTTCIGGLESRKTGLLDKTGQVDETRVFGTEPSGDMDFTTCVGGLESKKTGLMDKTGQADQTRVFGAEAAGDMDFTTCIGGLESRKTGLLDKIGQVDETRVFGTEPSGDMDFTTCVGGLESKKTGLMDKTGQLDKTRVFGAEALGDMDLTTCVGGLESKKTGLLDKSEQLEKTRVFSAEALGDMDLTTCVGGLESRKTGLMDKSGQLEKTRVFGAEALGDMDLTTCVGGLESRKTGLMDKSGQLEKTRVFGAEATDNMDFTACVGGLESRKTGLMDKTGQLERTRVFGAEATDNMDFTACVGGLESRKTGLMDKTGQLDKTRVFGADATGDMDFTTCIGGLESKKTGLMDKTGQFEKTRVFGPEATGNMDFTTCVGGFDDTVLADAHIDLVDDQDSDDDVITSTLPQLPETLACVPVSSAQGGAGDRKDWSRETSVSRRGSDFIESSQYSKKELNSSKFLGNETVAGSVYAEDSDEEVIVSSLPGATEVPTAKIKQQSSDGPTTAEDEQASPKRLLCSENGDSRADKKRKLTIRDEVVVAESDEDSDEVFKKPGNNDPVNTAPRKQCAIASDEDILSEKPPDDMENVTFELPSFLSQTVGDVSIDPTAKSLLTNITMNSVLYMTKDSIKNLSDLREFAGILKGAFLTSRRSVIKPVQCRPPESLAEHLQNKIINATQIEVYEWACQRAEEVIKNLRTSVSEVEEQANEELQSFFESIAGMTADQQRDLKQKTKALMDTCKTSAKTALKEWKIKLVKRMVERYQEDTEELANVVESIKEATVKIDTHISSLEEVEKSLDDEIKELEWLDSISEDDLESFVKKKEQVSFLQKELNDKEMKLRVLEMEEKACLIKEEEEKGKLADARELVEKRRTEATHAQGLVGDIARLQDKYKRLGMYCEGELLYFDETRWEIGFLSKSLVMTLTFGEMYPDKTGPLQNREIKEINFLSYLPDDAQPLHSFIHKSLLVKALKEFDDSEYPSTRHIRQLMNWVSHPCVRAHGLMKEIHRIEELKNVLKVTYKDGRIHITYSCWEAFNKFTQSIDVNLLTYPHQLLDVIYIHGIGSNRDEALQKVLYDVQPGWGLLYRIAKETDQYLQELPRSAVTQSSGFMMMNNVGLKQCPV